MGSPVYLVIANIYLEHFESWAISTFPTLIKWWFRYVYDVHSASRKDQVNKLQEDLNPIDPHINSPQNFQEQMELPFLDTLTTPTPNCIESLFYRKSPTQIGT